MPDFCTAIFPTEAFWVTPADLEPKPRFTKRTYSLRDVRWSSHHDGLTRMAQKNGVSLLVTDSRNGLLSRTIRFEVWGPEQAVANFDAEFTVTHGQS